MQASRRTHTNEYFIELLLPESLFCSGLQPSLPLQDLPLVGRWVWPSLYGVLLFSPESWCTQDLSAPFQEWSLCFLQPCGIPAVKSCWPSKPNSLGTPSPVTRLQTGSLTRGSELPILWDNFCGLIVFLFCELPTCWVWDLILTWLHPSCHLIVASLSLDVGQFFSGRFQPFFLVTGSSAVSCEFGVFLRRWVHTLCSTNYSIAFNLSFSVFFNWSIMYLQCYTSLCCTQSDSVQSLSCVRPHGRQHTRPLCPSPTSRVYSNSCPLSRWCHPAISSSVIPFSSCL